LRLAPQIKDLQFPSVPPEADVREINALDSSGRPVSGARVEI
jgi:hypothetical protein